MKTYTFHIAEMHCPSCTVLTEFELAQHPKVTEVSADLATKEVRVRGDFGTMPVADIAHELDARMREHGYRVTLGIDTPHHRTGIPPIAFPIAGLIIAAFIVMQTLGIAQVLGNGTPTPATALLIGFIASLSSCGAVVGGLALSLTAHYAHKGERLLPQISFHIGRLVAFFLLGGLLGAIGSIVSLGFYGTIAINLVIAIVMLLLGLHLLGFATPRAPALPAFVTTPIRRITATHTPATPFVLGVLTFFLPCGFTQSAQLYTLTLGDFGAGATFMSMFALGTLPVLAIISFLPLAFRSPEKKAIFDAVAGILVTFFAVYTAYTILTPII